MLGKILIIEDNPDSAELARYRLEQANYEVRIATNGVDGLREAYVWQPDLVLLDVMLPEMSGWTVCERLRQITNIPIIFLTVLEQEKHLIRGFTIGADDYITKPFDHRELLARVEAVLRRQAMHAPSRVELYVHKDLKIDLVQRTVTRGNEKISLTQLEFKLLACLAENPGKSLSHNYLIRRVWGANQHSNNSLKLYIWYLRRKLELDPAHPEIILTDHGVGYRLSEPTN
jgi:two-component system KDP operon response regulator KdpE